MLSVAPAAAGAHASQAMIAATHARPRVADRPTERLRAMYPPAAETNRRRCQSAASSSRVKPSRPSEVTVLHRFGPEVAGEDDRRDRDHAVDHRGGNPEARGQVAQEDQRVADVFGQVAVVELGLGSDAEEARCGAVGRRVVVLEHVALLDADGRLGQDRDSERVRDRQPLVVDRLDQPPDALGDALLVEQEVAARPLEEARVEQRDRRMDHRVAVLERGLEDAFGLLDGRPDVLDEVVQPVGPRSREPREVHAGGELEEDVDDARLGDPHRVRQRAGLADDVALVVEVEPGGALEGDRARARPGADQHGHAVAQVRLGEDGVRLGGVGGPDDQDEFGTVDGLGEVVAGVPDRGEALEIAHRGDAAGLVHGGQVRAELRRGVERHLVAVLGEVERRRDPSVTRSEHCHPHPEPP